MGTSGQIFLRGSGFRDTNYIYILLYESYLNYYLRANWKMSDHLLFFSLMFLAYFVLLKLYLILFYLINSLFKRKSV